MDIDSAKRTLEKASSDWLIALARESLSETDTRCKVIDFVLKDVLGWQESAIKREPHVQESNRYIDYLLSTTRAAYVVEAKRSDALFKLPSTTNRRVFKIGGVLWEDKLLKDAILQASKYAQSKGVSFCCVSNGSQYVFYRSQNDLGVSFLDQNAVVFSSIQDVIEHFNDFYNCLSFESVAEGRHYAAIQASDSIDDGRKFKRLSQPRSSASFRNRNLLFPFIREVVSEVFQDLASENASDDLIEKCYVASGRDSSYDQSLRALLKDRPTFAEMQVEPIVVHKKDAGGFEKVIERNGIEEVVLLLGGIGAGKSTFIQRFRKVIAKNRIDDECIWAYVNFNHYSDAPGYLPGWVAETITNEIEKDYPELEFGGYAMLKQAYHAEYERLKRGRLAPIFEKSSSEFEVEFSKSLADFEQDKIQHLIKVLKAAASRSKRRVFLVFDNADQFSSPLQNDVFMLARRIAQAAGCSLVISLREESYWKNKDHGALSAFHSVNFHLEAPRIQQVISKRFKYAEELLHESLDNYVVPSGGLGVTPEEGTEVFDALKHAILGADKSFVDFLEKMSPGEVRRPLDQLSRFMFSGHTNVDAVLKKVRAGVLIPIGFHEFFKAVALGDREFFDEQRSDVVNLFALDGAADASNLNRLAVLGRVLKARSDHSETGVGWLSLEKLVNELGAVGVLEDTTLAIVDFLNARRILETESQIRDSARGASFLRATPAAEYYIKDLGRRFVYVDMIVTGTTIVGNMSFDIIERLTKQIDDLGYSNADRISRLELRIERSRAFAKYLVDEAAEFSGFDDSFVDASVLALINEMDSLIQLEGVRIIESAKSIFAKPPAEAKKKWWSKP